MKSQRSEVLAHHGSAAAGQAVTPRRMKHEEINAIVLSLKEDWQLEIPIRDTVWSPSQNANKPSLANSVFGKIKRCFYSNPEGLQQTLGDFRLHAPTRRTSEERLKCLDSLLQSVLSQVEQQHPSQRSLKAELNGEQPARIARYEDTESYYTTAPESGSTTEDDEDYGTPPSPSPSSRSRRIQHPQPLVTMLSIGDKRPSEEPVNLQTSPKFVRNDQGRQTPSLSIANRDTRPQTPGLFKKPSLDMAPSFQSGSARTSFNTSFNSTLISSQSTQPDTANTSFASEIENDAAKFPLLSRTSSTTMGGSLRDEDLLERLTQVEQQLSQLPIEKTQGSTPRHGSDDDSALVNILDNEEERLAKAPFAINIDGSPDRAPSQPAPHITPGKISSRISYHIRDIHKQNLFVDDIPDDLESFPYFVLFICQRIASEHNVSLHALMTNVGQGWDDRDFLQQEIRKLRKFSHTRIPESRNLWASASKRCEGYTFKGKLVFNSRIDGPVFKLELLPVQSELSCRFQRRFGADRFLYLTLPEFDSSSTRRFNKNQLNQIRERWKDWFCTEHSFLGRKWRAFHIEPIKKGKGSRRTDNSPVKRMVLFATDGYDIKEPMSVGEMMNWFFPFSRNGHQSFCKAYARLDLGLSRTVPTLVFKPSQIKFVDDISADGSAEETEFDDPSLAWDEIYEEKTVMNDGCSLISVGAMQEVWRLFKMATSTNDPIPSVIQGRIGGAKGIWIVSAETYSKDRAHRDIWIQINESQLKFKPHPEDESDHKESDPHRLTFEVVGYSSQPIPTDLHSSFIPVMVDRGVPTEEITQLMVERLDSERDQLLSILSDPVRIHVWVHKTSWENRGNEEIYWEAGLPASLGDRVKFMLEGGFSPSKEPYLAKALSRLIKTELFWREKKLRVPLGKATNLYGIADPYGILAPGEVHVQFSVPFLDNLTEERFQSLDGLQVLVARHPACRRSDIQKVRATVKPHLSHLVDVVVFPTRGRYPLAGKLQGGDYDGDIFWLCWEDALVKPFRNAPAPLQALNPQKYGIKKDTRKVSDIMGNIRTFWTVDNLLREALDFRFAPDLLGMVTNFHEKLSYAENRIHSTNLEALCDMHDLLVDAPKQGYTFTDKDFQRYVKDNMRLKRFPELPAYKAAIEASEKAKEMGEADKVRSQNWLKKADNVLDYLYFDVVQKHNDRTLEVIGTILDKKTAEDPAVRYPYQELRKRQDPTVDLELDALTRSLQDIHRAWNTGMRKGGGASNYNSVVAETYRRYQALMPIQVGHPEIKPWITPYLVRRLMTWETIRASTLYSIFPEKEAFVFHMAGREITDLKCGNQRGSRSMCAPIYANIKPKPMKAPKHVEEQESSDEDFGTPLEELL